MLQLDSPWPPRGDRDTALLRSGITDERNVIGQTAVHRQSWSTSRYPNRQYQFRFSLLRGIDSNREIRPFGCRRQIARGGRPCNAIHRTAGLSSPNSINHQALIGNRLPASRLSPNRSSTQTRQPPSCAFILRPFSVMHGKASSEAFSLGPCGVSARAILTAGFPNDSQAEFFLDLCPARR